jgi:membrane protein required for colicin V production
LELNWVDILILVLLAVSALLGFRSGLIQSIFSLVGLILGIAVASWHYQRFEENLLPVVHSQALAAAVSFALIAIVVMVVAGLLGLVLKSIIHGVGLGWLDKLAGLVFGLLRGALLVTLGIVVLVAFFPDSRWLGEARLSRYFLGAAHLTVRMSPEQLERKAVHGLRVLEEKTPEWLHDK